MLSRPTEDPPRWATNDVIDGVTGTNNVVEPPEEKKDAGWNRAEYPAREWFNWFQRGAGEWLAYLAQQSEATPINTLNIDETGTNALPDPAMFGTGIVWAASFSDPADFAVGLIYPSGGAWVLVPVINNTLSLSVSGRNVTVSGGVAADTIINSIAIPVTVLND